MEKENTKALGVKSSMTFGAYQTHLVVGQPPAARRPAASPRAPPVGPRLLAPAILRPSTSARSPSPVVVTPAARLSPPHAQALAPSLPLRHPRSNIPTPILSPHLPRSDLLAPASGTMTPEARAHLPDSGGRQRSARSQNTECQHDGGGERRQGAKRIWGNGAGSWAHEGGGMNLAISRYHFSDGRNVDSIIMDRT